MPDLVPPLQPGNGAWSWYYFGSDWSSVRSGSGSNEPLSAGEIVGLSFGFSGQFFVVQGFIAFGLGQFELDEISSLSLRLEVGYNDLPVAQEMVVRSYTDWSYDLGAGDFVPAGDLSSLLEVGSTTLDPQTSGTVDIPIDLSVLAEVSEGTIGLLLHPRLQEDASPPGAQHDDALAFDASASLLVVSDDPGDHQAGAGDVTSIARIDGAGHAPPLVVPTGSGSIDVAGAPDGEGHIATAGAGQLDGTATLDGDGAAATSGAGLLATVGALDAIGTTVTSGTGTIETTGTLTGAGEAHEAATGAGTITAVGTLDGAGHVSHAGTGHLGSIAAIDGAGHAGHAGTGQTDTVGTIVGVGFAPDFGVPSGAGAIAAAGTVDGTGYTSTFGTGTLTTVGLLVGAAAVDRPHLGPYTATLDTSHPAVLLDPATATALLDTRHATAALEPL